MLNIPHVESPFFEEHFPAAGTDPELLRVARSLHEEGFAVLDFPDERFERRVEEILANLSDRFDWEAWRADQVEGLRVQDAWQFDEQVRAIATNEAMLRMLSQLYGRKAFPFQTLNFPVGTQQHYHTDCVHFASVPERFMCGVWVAFEDVGDDAGPLLYYPKSHRLPIYLNEHLGTVPGDGEDPYETYDQFVEFWRRLVAAHGLQPVDLLRQSVYSRLAGYEDLNDAVRVSADPTFRLIGSKRNWDRGAALTSTLHGFETEMLASEENLLGLMAVNRELVAQAETAIDSDRVVLDMDSTESPVHGQQEGSAYNGRDAAAGQSCGRARTRPAGDRAPTGCGQAGHLPGRCGLCQAGDL